MTPRNLPTELAGQQPHARALQPLDGRTRLVILFQQGELRLQLESRSENSQDPEDFHPLGTSIVVAYRHVGPFMHKLNAVVERAGSLALFAPVEKPQ